MSKEHYVSQPRMVNSYETQRTDTTQRRTPVSTKQVVTVTEGTGSNFNRAAEMAEVSNGGKVEERILIFFSKLLFVF